jgi:hypothetical protein
MNDEAAVAALAKALHESNVDCDYSRKFDRKSCGVGDGPHSITAAAILDALRADPAAARAVAAELITEEALGDALNQSSACLTHGDTFIAAGCPGCAGRLKSILRALRGKP